jgi:hypothetical protein
VKRHTPSASEPIRPLCRSEQVGAVFAQLHQTRAQEDNRCLRSEPEPEEVEEAMADTVDESQDAPQSQMPYTQHAFGTQLAHPIQSRTNEDGPQPVGVNRLEPVIVGNTRQEDIRPGAAKTDYHGTMRLLSLLERAPRPSSSKQSTSSAQGFVQSALSEQHSVAGPATDASPKSHAIPAYQEPARSGAEEEGAKPTSPTLGSGRKRAREPRRVSPKAAESAKEALATRPDDGQSEDTTPHALKCSWMKGLPFNSEALKVPKLQQENLARDTSWLKPQPGVKSFLDGNMPQIILTELNQIADERAALEETGETDESEVDPSPNSQPEEVDPSPESLSRTTQADEPPTSEVSWSSSPEPPQQPTKSRQGLPPDSSIEKQVANAEHDVDLRPKPSGRQSKRAPVIDPLDDDEPMIPPSSPPVVEAHAESDEEMGMEEYMPQAFGEDTAEGDQTQVQIDDLPTIKSSHSPSVVQVEETPYGKGKTVQRTAAAASPRESASKQAQDSSGNPKRTSSTSIIYSTYDMQNSPGSADGERDRTRTVQDRSIELENKTTGDGEQGDEVHPDSVEQVNDTDAQDVSMVDVPPQTEDAPEPIEQESCGVTGPQTVDAAIDRAAPASEMNATLKSAPLLSRDAESSVASSHVPQPSSGSTKRKPVASPTKSHRRQSKKRQLKIVGFGDAPSPPIAPQERIRQDREESLRRFREERMSSKSFDSGAEPASKLVGHQGADIMNVDRPDDQPSAYHMSPRHQSLYDEPSPKTTTPTARPASQYSSRKVPSNDVSSATPARQTQAALSEFRSTLDSHSKKTARPSDAPDSKDSETVFQTFKATYSEYTGDSKHFHTQCKQMLKLDGENKVLPEWQWDDFIIRNRTDYKDYAMECLDAGEDAEPWYRYYKDNIRDTLYQKGVVGSRKTLQKALEELNGQPAPGPQRQPTEKSKERQQPAPALPRQAANSTAQRQAPSESLPGTSKQKTPAQPRLNGDAQIRPRTSLLEAFEQQKKPAQARTNGSTASKPRHSLPSRPSQSSAPNLRPSDIFRPKLTSTSKPASNSHAQLDGSTDDIPESTGDPFRDFYFAMQRSKSWVGTDEVGPTDLTPSQCQE